MGEARRRKKLDPNYGKPNYLKILIDYNPREYPKYYTTEIWRELATRFVPQEILDCAVDFSRGVMSYTPPPEILQKFPPKYPSGLIELEWNSITKEWIIEFVMDLDKSQSLTNLQTENAFENIKKAITFYVDESWDEDTWDDEDYDDDDDDDDDQIIEKVDLDFKITELTNVKFPADDNWDYTFDENGSGGDLDFCLGQLYDYITAEIDLNYSFGDLEIMEERLELLYQKRILEVRQQCLESGSAYGENWSITHQSLW